MKRSTRRILTTHGGNLPRPPAFEALLADPEIEGKLIRAQAMARS